MIMQQIVVTGGAGFIGSYTVNLLLATGKQVIVIDNLSTGQLTNLNLDHPSLRFVEGDVRDYPLLLSLIRECDAVLHLAALRSIPHSIENPILSCEVNSVGFLHVLQAIREVNPEARLVYASSAAVYGADSVLPCSDEVPLSAIPLSPYALEKITNEQYADLYYRLFGIKSLGLRYFNVYGTGQDPHSSYAGVISTFIKQYQNNEEMLIFGNGEQSRDFIHVSDVAQANGLALSSAYYGVVNIATGIPETLLNLVRYIELAGQKPAKMRLTAMRPGDIVHSHAKIDKAEKHLAFHYKTRLAQGISSFLK